MKIVKFEDGTYGVRRWNWGSFSYRFYSDDRGIYGWDIKRKSESLASLSEAKILIKLIKSREDDGVPI